MRNTINIEQIKETLVSIYGIKVIKMFPTERGMSNHSFFVYSKKRKYVFRVYSNRNNRIKDHILFEIKVMRLLRKNKLPVPKIIETNNEDFLATYIYNNKKYFCILMEFIEGKMLEKNDLYIVKSLGSLQAKMHSILEKKVEKRLSVKQILSNWLKWSREELGKIKPFLIKYNLKETYLKIFEETQAEFNKELKNIGKMPYAECHNDFWGGNILIKNKHIVGILDFDSMNASFLVADLANTLRSCLFRSNPKKYPKIISDYLSGYQKYRKLSEKELNILPLMIAVRNFATTNLVFAKGMIKNKKRILEAIKFHNNWKKHLLKNKMIV